MKYRTGFVSNSSSSSFIITGKENIKKAKEMLQDCRYDYYEYNDKLYTQDISDWSDIYESLQEIDHDSYDSWGSERVDIEGELGIGTVSLPKDVAKSAGLYNNKESSEAYQEVKNFIKKHKIKFDEMIYDTDKIAEDSLNFIESLCNIVGYYKGD